MTDTTIIFLGLVVGSTAVFALTLAYVSAVAGEKLAK